MKKQVSKLEQFAAKFNTEVKLTNDQQKAVKGGGFASIPLGITEP